MSAIAVRIDLAQPADARPIALLSRELIEYGLEWTWTPARVATQIRREDCLVIRARVGRHSLAGFAILRFADQSAHLNLLGVARPFQSQGLGKRLLGWLEETALAGGVFDIFLEVRASNRTALNFYRAAGYRSVHRLPNYYCGREDGLCMARDLRAQTDFPLGRARFGRLWRPGRT